MILPHEEENAALSESGPALLKTREVALSLAEAVLVRKQSLDQALESAAAFKALEPRDRGFARMAASTMLRRLSQIDDIIARLESKGGASQNLSLQNILRLGVTQILFMDVPDYAAVDTSVRLAEKLGITRQKSFVNALLRSVTRQGKEILSRQDAGRLCTPEWLLKLWIEDYGLGKAARIAAANLTEAPLDFTLKDPGTRSYWSGLLGARDVPTGSLRKESGGDVTRLPGFLEGAWWVQDAAAAIPARLFGALKGKSVIDLCAAPGGKTAQLAANGARVTALDRSRKRLQRLEDNMARLSLQQNVTVITEDATVWRPQEKADYILLDAPCTATGTLRRHPDVAHLKSPEDMARLLTLQQSLLRNAFEMLREGGTLIYCTCSLQKAEGEAQIARFLESDLRAQRKAILPEEIGGLSDLINEEGDVRVFPFHLEPYGGLDGFFVSRLIRL